MNQVYQTLPNMARVVVKIWLLFLLFLVVVHVGNTTRHGQVFSEKALVPLGNWYSPISRKAWNGTRQYQMWLEVSFEREIYWNVQLAKKRCWWLNQACFLGARIYAIAGHLTCPWNGYLGIIIKCNRLNGENRHLPWGQGNKRSCHKLYIKPLRVLGTLSEKALWTWAKWCRMLS